MPQANYIYPSELIANLSRIVQNIADMLVVHTESVELTAHQEPAGTTFVLFVSPSDLRRVVGERGHIAQSIRTVLAGASKKYNHPVRLELKEHDNRP